jgi:HD-GYP domain-containing protein (c-di-GMP phosphodiesterase class II)
VDGPENTNYEEQARKALEDDPHYLTAVAAMGDRKAVVSGEPIFSSQGLKLVDEGVAINSRLRDRLLCHKLMKPIDHSLTAERGVSGADLAAQASCLFDAFAWLRRLFPFPPDRERVCAALAALELTPALAFKLTVAREQRPRLLDHLLAAAMICQYLARRLELGAADTDDLLLAALLHDLGELHTDPAMLEPGRRLDRDEMRYIYAHPITGCLIAQSVVPGRPAVAVAVLEHQERDDGSGYPYGLRAEATSRLGRIVGVVDVCVSILTRFGNNSRLSALMRLNRRKYDPELISLLHKGFGSQHDDDGADDIVVLPELKAVAKLIHHWSNFRASFACGAGAPPQLDFLFERMVNMNAMLLQFGFDPNSLQLLRAAIADDRKLAAELAEPLNEVRWQFGDLEREIMRRKETATKSLSPDTCMFLDDWLADLRQYLESSAAPS